MPGPQSVLRPLSGAALFLVLTVEEGGEDDVRELLADVSALRRGVGFRVPGRSLSCIVGIGSDLWDRLFGLPKPRRLHPFVPLAGDQHSAPATPGDLLFHLRADTMDLCFELGTKLVDRLRGVATVVDETHGFRYFEQRDLMGFVDGTENPEDEAAVAAALVGDREPDFADGSYVMVQKYTHDMDAWNALHVEEQERAMGRSKLDDIEMDDAVKPANSHIALNDLDDDAEGNPREILRDNMPFGEIGTSEFGTYFIGYAGDLDVTEEMLRNMFLGDPPGNYDRILDFSTAVTGSVFFCPSVDFLDDPPGAPGVDETEEPAATDAPADGSLHIGDLHSATD